MKNILIIFTVFTVMGCTSNVVMSENAKGRETHFLNDVFWKKANVGAVKDLQKSLNVRAILNYVDNDNRTSLMYAAKNTDNVEVVKYLLNNGVDKSLTDNKGNTALFYAASYNNFRVFKYLYENDVRFTSLNSLPIVFSLSKDANTLRFILNSYVGEIVYYNKSVDKHIKVREYLEDLNISALDIDYYNNLKIKGADFGSIVSYKNTELAGVDINILDAVVFFNESGDLSESYLNQYIFNKNFERLYSDALEKGKGKDFIEQKYLVDNGKLKFGLPKLTIKDFKVENINSYDGDGSIVGSIDKKVEVISEKNYGVFLPHTILTAYIEVDRERNFINNVIDLIYRNKDEIVDKYALSDILASIIHSDSSYYLDKIVAKVSDKTINNIFNDENGELSNSRINEFIKTYNDKTPAKFKNSYGMTKILSIIN